MYYVAILAACAGLALSNPAAVRMPNEEFNFHWELFKSTYEKTYADVNEETTRRLIWEDHLALIASHNREHDLGLHTYTLGINKYADMSNEEFVRVLNGYKQSLANPSDVRTTFVAPNYVALPDSVDWRTQGYVTPIKDQGQCGSCWAFSTTGSLEGQHFKSTGQLVSLSEQNLVDCSGAEGNEGCDGGLMDNAFTYIKKNGGIDTESSYPYKAQDGKCKFNKANIGATDTGFVDIKKGNETDLQVAVATVGPVSVAIDASHNSFQLYKSGIYNEKHCSTTQLDHGVLAVGYGTTAGKDFWIVKNSWGTGWGEQGYIQMSRNAKNQCGIATEASYPLV